MWFSPQFSFSTANCRSRNHDSSVALSQTVNPRRVLIRNHVRREKFSSLFSFILMNGLINGLKLVCLHISAVFILSLRWRPKTTQEIEEKSVSFFHSYSTRSMSVICSYFHASRVYPTSCVGEISFLLHIQCCKKRWTTTKCFCFRVKRGLDKRTPLWRDVKLCFFFLLTFTISWKLEHQLSMTRNSLSLTFVSILAVTFCWNF